MAKGVGLCLFMLGFMNVFSRIEGGTFDEEQLRKVLAQYRNAHRNEDPDIKRNAVSKHVSLLPGPRPVKIGH